MTLRPRKCRVCKVEFPPVNTFHRVCSLPCSFLELKANNEKKYRAETKRRKAAIKTHGQWVQEVQVEFNRYVRARDAGRPCISCGRASGAKLNAGHYRPTSTCPELRFNEINCHLQCEHCNTYKSGNLSEYRFFLIGRIGLSLVEWLEGPHKPMKPTIDELKWLKKYYKQRTKEALSET